MSTENSQPSRASAPGAREPKRRRPRTRWKPADIDAALAVLASCGSSFEAEEITGINASTLRQWKVEHAERFQAIREREGPKLEAIAAAQAREIMIRAGETEHALLDLLNGHIRDETSTTKQLTEVAGALQRVTTSKGINGTKLLELTGRPTSIVEHRDSTDILRRLGSKVPGLIIEASATEVPPAQRLLAAPDIANARVEPNAGSNHEAST